MRRRGLFIGLVVLVGVLLSACARQDVSTVDRPYDPVVLFGAQVPRLVGTAPQRLVAFRFVYGTWQQVPVQVDERAVLDLNKPKNGAPVGKSALFYTDPDTWTGADPDATLDSDDEIVFMANRAFGQARSIDDDQRNVHYTLDEPDGVVAGSGVEVKISDPLETDATAWIYLFRSDGTLSPGAGVAPTVDYDFNLVSGDYRSTYRISGGANPENSTVRTPTYSAHFADRWIQDALRVTAGGATGVDILDGHKAGFAGTCGRSETTFSTGGGAIIANTSGPVRAVRSYLGANSGTFTQRDHLMYENRIDTVTHLRVHAVPPLRDWIDLSEAARGMTVSSSTRTAGATVDGVPDTFPTANPTWHMARGAQGSIVNTSTIETNISGLAANIINFYEDDTTPVDAQCSGDAFALGAHGATVNQNVPDTDPRTGSATFRSTRRTTVLPPNAPVATAQEIGTQASTPLALAASPFSV